MNDQATTLRRLHQGEQKAKMGAIVSGKGGVGKSNTVVNMAIELKKCGHTVLLCDLDIGMGNIHLLTGQSATNTVVDFLQNRDIIQNYIEKGPKGIDYIAGGPSLSTVFQLGDEELDFFIAACSTLMQMYDYILFDVGAGATENNFPFILAADECIVITTLEPPAIMDAYSMIKLIAEERGNVPISIIINHCQNDRTSKEALGQFIRIVEQFLGIVVTPLGILPYDQETMTATNRQLPYTNLDEQAGISKAIKQITQNFINKNNLQMKANFSQRLGQLFRR